MSVLLREDKEDFPFVIREFNFEVQPIVV